MNQGLKFGAWALCALLTCGGALMAQAQPPIINYYWNALPYQSQPGVDASQGCVSTQTGQVGFNIYSLQPPSVIPYSQQEYACGVTNAISGLENYTFTGPPESNASATATMSATGNLQTSTISLSEIANYGFYTQAGDSPGIIGSVVYSSGNLASGLKSGQTLKIPSYSISASQNQGSATVDILLNTPEGATSEYTCEGGQDQYSGLPVCKSEITGSDFNNPLVIGASGMYSIMATGTVSIGGGAVGIFGAAKASINVFLTQCGPFNVKLQGNGGQTLFAQYTPTNGQTLEQAATACGYSGFDWQQTVTNLPCPSPYHASLGGANACGPSTPTPGNVTAPPSFFDPPPGGYSTSAAGFNPAPFYYNPADAASTGVEGPVPPYDPYLGPNGSQIPINNDGLTLSFSDTPTDPCLFGDFGDATKATLRAANCGGATSTAPSGSKLEFTTALVGVLPGGQPSAPLTQWNWTDTYNGTSGQIAYTSSSGPVDPNSGTGGITITSIDGVPVVPAVIPSTQVKATASGLVYSRVSKTFNGTVTVTNISASPISGPMQVLLTGLPASVTLANAEGISNGMPFVPFSTVPDTTTLGPGQSATVTVQFTNPSNVAIHFTPTVYSGSLY